MVHNLYFSDHPLQLATDVHNEGFTVTEKADLLDCAT